MDRLFRKRTISTKEAHGLPISSKSSPIDPVWPEKATLRKKRKDKSIDVRPGSGASSAVGDAPRVELDIRSSLMFPGLSQRFSVLLPSLSGIPANSLRDQLATQRQRGGPGPAITEEEEELLFAELQDIEAYRRTNLVTVSPTIPMEWDGRPPLSSSFSSTSLANWENQSRRTIGGLGSGSGSFMVGSSSTPNLLSALSDEPARSPTATSPPPTSTSFDSFATFGVNSDDRATSPSIRTKSYGFSGGSGMRDHEYLRRVKKSASSRNISGSSRSISIRSDDSDETARKEFIPQLPPISTERANALRPGGKDRPRSNGSDRTATPSSGIPSGSGKHSLAKRHHSPSSSLSLNNPPLHPAPISPLPPTPPPEASLPPAGRNKNQRKSMLQGLSQAQMKRISAALLDLGYGMDQGGWNKGKGAIGEEKDDDEETLEHEEWTSPSTRPSEDNSQADRRRYDSNAKSEASAHSTGSSSVFPYHVSPTTSSFAGAVQIQPPSQPSSPPATAPLSSSFGGIIPPGQADTQRNGPPKSLVINEAARPVPILTPTKSRPVRHNASFDSTSSPASAVPGYIPGQPRPVGSVRSEGSGSSRSATPTNIRVASGTSETSSPNRGRSDSSPTPVRPPQVKPRTTSLARSRSIQQNTGVLASPPFTAPVNIAGPSRTVETSSTAPALTEPNWTHRLSSPLAFEPPKQGIIEEGNETEGEDHFDEEHRNPMIYTVPSRRSVARSTSDSTNSLSATSRDLGPISTGLPEGSRAASQQGFIEAYSDQSHSRHASFTTPKQTLRNMRSIDSLGSGYQVALSHEGAMEGDGTSQWSPGEVILTPEEDQTGELKLLCGVDKQEFRQMQIRLIDKARAEREALRDGVERSFSPIPNEVSKPVNLNIQTLRAPSPPPMLAYRATTPDITETRPTPTSPVFLGNIITPPAPPSQPFADRRPAAAPPAAPTPPIQTPSEQHDEIFTPPSEQLSRQVSQKAQIASGGAPEDDPEKIRDFEARIAAATAALNRTPSSGGYKLERKSTKKGGGSVSGNMVISTPRLLSSSINLLAQRLESPESTDTHAQNSKALENASGSSKKMSLRWRKLGLGKKTNPSISSSEIYSPPSSTGGSPNPQKLDEPISLSKSNPPPPLPLPLPRHGAGMPQNDLKGFKFPPQSASDLGHAPPPVSGIAALPSPPGTANPTTGLRQIMGKGKTDNVVQIDGSQQSSTGGPLQPPSGSGADDSVAKFIAAGRAVGLNDQQLNEMLLAKGMVKKTEEGQALAVPKENGITNNTLATSTSSQSDEKQQKDTQPKEKSNGLFRALSRKKSKTGLLDKSKPAAAPTAPTLNPVEIDLTESRNKVVRRTLLLPDSAPVTPQPYRSPNTNADSPTNFGRKPSIRRKPVNMTQEDERLVAQSSPVPSRNASQTSVQSESSESIPSAIQAFANKADGLGFLHPNAGVGGRRESGGGSLYDLYGNAPDDKSGTSEGESQKGIEIMEYEDGRVVWGVIDALRDEDAEGSEYTQTGIHSRQTSNASSYMLSEARDAPAGMRGPVAPLNLRHRDRGPQQARPETNLYFTSPTDIGDLIDQLSRDPTGNKGRIDFLPPSPDPAGSFQPMISSPSLSAPGQFEDAPSPRRSPPAPISVPRTNNIPAGGFSPKRQKFVQQGFGRTVSGARPLMAPNPGPSLSSAGLGPAASPSAAIFASSQSGGKPVEDRLQALMDRLVSSGATRKV